MRAVPCRGLRCSNLQEYIGLTEQTSRLWCSMQIAAFGTVIKFVEQDKESLNIRFSAGFLQVTDTAPGVPGQLCVCGGQLPEGPLCARPRPGSHHHRRQLSTGGYLLACDVHLLPEHLWFPIRAIYAVRNFQQAAGNSAVFTF